MYKLALFTSSCDETKTSGLRLVADGFSYIASNLNINLLWHWSDNLSLHVLLSNAFILKNTHPCESNNRAMRDLRAPLHSGCVTHTYQANILVELS